MAKWRRPICVRAEPGSRVRPQQVTTPLSVKAQLRGPAVAS